MNIDHVLQQESIENEKTSKINAYAWDHVSNMELPTSTPYLCHMVPEQRLPRDVTFGGSGVPVPKIMDASAVVVKLIPQERIQRRTVGKTEMSFPQVQGLIAEGFLPGQFP